MSLSSSLLLHAMEQQKQFIQVGKEYFSDKIAVCFSDDMSKMAYSYKTPHNEHYLSVMGIDNNGFTPDEGMILRSDAQALCFNTNADQIGILTNDGQVTIVHCENDYRCEMPPCRDKVNVFTALAYAQGSAFKKGNFFATTKDGELFKIRSGHQDKRVYSLSKDPGIASLNISSLSWNNRGSMIAFIGTANICAGYPLGYIHIIPAVESSFLKVIPFKVFSKVITTACFDECGESLVFAKDRQISVLNTKDGKMSPLHDALLFNAAITKVCSAGHNKLFVGLEDGSLYFCTMQQEYIVNCVKLLQWEHPIAALLYNKEKNLFGVATLHQAALIKAVSNFVYELQ